MDRARGGAAGQAVAAAADGVKLRWPGRRLTLLLAALCVLNTLPAMLLTLGGDMVFHLMLTHCFADQLWQGDLYPRWCRSANAGLGGGFFLTYFPLSYYVQALLMPLAYAGMPERGVYAVGMLLAGFATALAAYAWLAETLPPKRAFMGAALLLFLPYRMEAMLHRVAYAEVWAMALMPLVLLYARRLALRQRGACPRLALCAGLLMLAHAPAALITLGAAGGYVLLTRWKRVAAYGGAMLWAAGLAAFYLAPAYVYRQYLVPLEQTSIPKLWVNTFLSWQYAVQAPAVMTAVGLSFLAAAGLIVARRRAGGEAQAWIILTVVSALLLLSVTEPLYALLGPLRQLVLPWRMQIVLSFGIVYLFAAGPDRQRPLDFALLIGALALLSYSLASVIAPESEAEARRLLAARLGTEEEHQTIWTDKAHYNVDYVLALHDAGGAAQAVPLGKAEVAVARWDHDGTVLETAAMHSFAVRIGQYYMPLWRARDESGETIEIHPEKGSGQVMLEVPAGRHEVTMTRDLALAVPAAVYGGYAASAATLLLLLLSRLPLPVFGANDKKRSIPPAGS